MRLLNQFKGRPSYDDTAANNDFALVTLASPVGQKAGWLGLEWATGASNSIDLTAAGASPASEMSSLQIRA